MKRALHLYINTELIALAQQKGINLSAGFEDWLKMKLALSFNEESSKEDKILERIELNKSESSVLENQLKEIQEKKKQKLKKTDGENIIYANYKG